MNGYQPKDLHLQDAGRLKLFNGVKKIAWAVGSTLGPLGNTVLIESEEFTHGLTSTKDGVTVAKSLALLDPVENLGVSIVRQAADKTATEAGDGTTTSVVMAYEMASKWMESDAQLVGLNRTAVAKHLDELSALIIADLKTLSAKVTSSKLIDVATISANGDQATGKVIADAYRKVGLDGVVMVEKSMTPDTYSEVTKGIRVDRGYKSPIFITDREKDECVYEDVRILVCDQEIANITSLEEAFKPFLVERKPILIIAQCTNAVVNVLAANVVKNNMRFVAIDPPSFGFRSHELMEDIATAVGAKHFSEKTGDDLSLIKPTDLGRAKKVIVGKDKTIIITDGVKSPQAKDRVTQLRSSLKLAKKKSDKDFIQSRIASLTGGIGVIFAGGNTDLEQKELYDRIDDAICAVRSAIEEGIVPGGGYTARHLGHALWVVPIKTHGTLERQVASDILQAGLNAPLKWITSNAGIKLDEVALDPSFPFGYGINAKDQSHQGNLIEMGIVDPTKVLRCAIENSVSVAKTLITTNAIITLARSYETK